MKDLLFEQQRTVALRAECEYCCKGVGENCVNKNGDLLEYQPAHFTRIKGRRRRGRRRGDRVSAPPYVLGIDSALTHTGVAVIELVDGACRARTEVVATAPAGATLAERHRRIDQVASGVGARVGHHAVLALVEAPALDAHHGNAWDRAALWWWIVGTLLDRSVPVAMIAPTTLKKWAAGRGGSKQRPVEKRHVVAAMHEMWPGLPCTAHEGRHHECEALAMAQMAAQHLGWPVPVRRHHGEPLQVVRWPELQAVPR